MGISRQLLAWAPIAALATLVVSAASPAEEGQRDDMLTVFYAVSDPDELHTPGWAHLLAGRTDVEISIRANARSREMVVTAPQSFHDELRSYLRTSRGEFAKTPRAQKLAALRETLERYERQFVVWDRMATSAEQSAARDIPGGQTMLDVVIEEHMARDERLAVYLEERTVLQIQVERLATSVRNPQDAQLLRLQLQVRHVEAQEERFRTRTEALLRQKLAMMPEEQLRDQLTALRSRHVILAERRKAAIEAKIDAVEAQLLELARERGPAAEILQLKK